MSGISAMFFGGTSFVFAGAWSVSNTLGAVTAGAGLALGYDGTSPYTVMTGYGDLPEKGSTLKVNTDRTTAWTRSAYPGGLNSGQAAALAIDTSYNTFFPVNTANNVGTDTGTTLIKTDTTGAVSWQRKFSTGGSPEVSATAVATDSSGNVYMAGNYLATNGGFLVKYNSSGTIQWQRTLDSDSQCTIHSVAVDGSGNVIVAGSYQFSGANRYAHITKYNSSGTLQWKKYVNLTATTYYTAIPAMVCDSSDNIYFYMSAGSTLNYYNYFAKLNSSGVMQWTRRTDNDDAYTTGGAYIDTDGYIYFVGYHGITSGTDGTYIVKYDSSGTRQFDRKLTNVTSPSGIVVDTQGFMWVQGTTTDNTDSYYFLSRLPSDGPGSLSFSLAALNGTITVDISTPALTENTTALTIGTSSLTDAAGTVTDSAGSLTTGTFSTTAYTAP